MLVFMTYNVRAYLICLLGQSSDLFQAYLIVAVVLGAAVGHYVFNPELLPVAADKGVACH